MLRREPEVPGDVGRLLGRQLSSFQGPAGIASPPRGCGGTEALDPWRRTWASHDHGFPAHGLERLPQADDAGVDAVGDADIDQDDVVGVMIDQIVDARNQLGVPAAAQPALEDRELHPFAVAVHQPEHAAPPLGVGDVVDDDVEVLHGVTGW